jgi:hypothetical protein
MSDPIALTTSAVLGVSQLICGLIKGGKENEHILELQRELNDISIVMQSLADVPQNDNLQRQLENLGICIGEINAHITNLREKQAQKKSSTFKRTIIFIKDVFNKHIDPEMADNAITESLIEKIVCIKKKIEFDFKIQGICAQVNLCELVQNRPAQYVEHTFVEIVKQHTPSEYEQVYKDLFESQKQFYESKLQAIIEQQTKYIEETHNTHARLIEKKCIQTKENASLIEEIKEWTLEKIREEREKEYEYKEQIIELKEQLTNHKLEIAQLKNEILDMKTNIADVYSKMQCLKPEIYSELKSELANELASQFQSEINSKFSCNSSLITFGNQLIESVTVNKVNESTSCIEGIESTSCIEGIDSDCPTFIKELIHDTKVLSYSTGIYTEDRRTQLMTYIASIIIFKKDGIKIIECGPEINQKRPSRDYYCNARYYYWNAYDIESVNGTSIIKQTIKMNLNGEHIAYYDDDKTTLIAEYKKDKIETFYTYGGKDYSKTYLKVYGNKDTIYESINIESFNYIYCPKSIGSQKLISLTHPKYIKYPRGTKIYYYYNTGHAEHSGLIYFYDGCAISITDRYQCYINITKSRVKYDKYTYNIQYFDEKNVLDCEYIHKSQTLQFYSNGSPIYETKTKNYEFVYLRFPE